MIGLECKLYRNTGTYGTPVWEEIENVRDLSNGGDTGEVDASTRGGVGWREREPTLRDAALDFNMYKKSGDTIYAAMRTLWINRTSQEFVAMDGDITVAGNTGIRFTGKVFSFKETQNLEGMVEAAVSVKPVPSTNPPEVMLISA